MTRPKIFGIAGWKNSGKTGLAVRLVTELVESRIQGGDVLLLALEFA